MKLVSRRELFRNLIAGTAVLALRAWGQLNQPGWDSVPGILGRIRQPEFPKRDFPVTKYGARPDGSTDATAAIAAAIEACHKAGGGRVVVPEGVFLTGAVHLRSNVCLHLEKGAVLRFSTDPTKYLPVVFTRYEGLEFYNYSPFIYAWEQENIGITGEGLLDGQAGPEHWWPWCGNPKYGYKPGGPTSRADRARLGEMAEKGVPVAERVFGEGHYMRPNFIQPYRCKNVLIEGVRIENSPMWEINPVLCVNVTVRGVRIVSHGPNNDGCDPESCRDVLIEDCLFDTGDDCIAIKSGRNADGRRVNVPTENVIIRNCEMKDGHGGVTVGSEVSGGVRNVYAEKCRMDSPNLDRALRLKTNNMRGGFIENVYMRDVEIGQVADAVLHVDYYYDEGMKGNFPPLVRNVRMERVSCKKARYAIFVRAFAGNPVRDVWLRDVTVENAERENVVEHVEGFKLENVVINGKPVGAQFPA